jgi:hypothetical protein
VHDAPAVPRLPLSGPYASIPGAERNRKLPQLPEAGLIHSEKLPAPAAVGKGVAVSRGEEPPEGKDTKVPDGLTAAPLASANVVAGAVPTSVTAPPETRRSFRGAERRLTIGGPFGGGFGGLGGLGGPGGGGQAAIRLQSSFTFALVPQIPALPWQTVLLWRRVGGGKGGEWAKRYVMSVLGQV